MDICWIRRQFIDMQDKETVYGYMLDKETGSECQECPELIQTCPSTEC